MFIIAGLGNPEKKYNNTPHNIGFEAIDGFAKKNDFPDFRLSKKINALISEKNNVILAKPQTFMNNSGLSIKKIIKWRSGLHLIIIHDDIDLPLGSFKIQKNRGSAGHKGVESIIKELGTQDFTRIRIGIHPQSRTLDYGTERYVLEKFSREDKKILKKVLSQVSLELENLIK